MTIAALREAIGLLLDSAPALEPEDLIMRARALRAQLEEILLGATELELLGLLNETVVTIHLYARERLRGRAESAEEYLQMGRLFLSAARDASR